MKINSENIEALIVDYFDGFLNDQQSSELLRAVAQNAEFSQLFNEYRSAMDCRVGETLSENINPEFAETLKQTSDFNDMDTPYFDRLAVLVAEGIATKAEQDEYNQMLLQDDTKLHAAVLYSYCKIEQNKDLQCPYKNNLKHSQIRPLRYAIAAAAAVLAFFLMFRVIYSPQYSIELAQQSGEIAKNYTGRNVYVADDYMVADVSTPSKPQFIASHLPNTDNSQFEAIEYNNVEPQSSIALPLTQEDTSISDVCVVADLDHKINYPEDNLQPINIDWESIEQLDHNGLAISMDFIGEQGIADFKEDKDRVRRRLNERRNPKICVSYDEDGRRDGVSLLIGNRELRVWSR